MPWGETESMAALPWGMAIADVSCSPEWQTCRAKL